MTETERAGLASEQVAGLRSGERAAVRAAVEATPRGDLTAWLRTPDGAEVLHDAFRRMPEFYVPGLVAQQLRARWQVRRPPAEPIAYDLILDPEGCRVADVDAGVPATVTLTFDSAGFVELACAARRGVDLMLKGYLHIRGDVQAAMRMERVFGLDGGRR